MRAALLLAALAGGCGAPEAGELERSCRGERVLECDPLEWTVVEEAALTPAGIGPLDPAAAAEVRVQLAACPMPPEPASVRLEALVPRSDGAGVRVVDLGISVRDDGTGGDAAAGDGEITAAVGSPFGAEIPERARIVLRFVPVLAGCTGEALELAYQTGPRYVPPP